MDGSDPTVGGGSSSGRQQTKVPPMKEPNKEERIKSLVSCGPATGKRSKKTIAKKPVSDIIDTAENPKNKGKKVATTQKADNPDVQEIGEIRNRSLPSCFVILNNSLTCVQKIALIEKKFGGLLNIGACTMPLHLSKWVMKCYDPDSSELVIPDRGKILVDADSVHRIWALPNYGLKVSYEMNVDIMREMMEDYGFPPTGSPDLTSWCKMIKDIGGRSDDMFFELGL